MNQEKLREAFLQGGEREASEVFNELMRSSVRAALWEMMSSEVESLCGPKYHPKAEGEYRRGGSEQGSEYLDGGKESVKRPRVRHVEDGEVELESYRAASSQSGLFEEVVGLVTEGMSRRGLGRVRKDANSKSAISRMWEEKSREQLAMVRERDLKGTDWLAVMIDGVFIGGENCVVIALGIEASGRKQVLDFEVGSSESRESVERLIGSTLLSTNAIENVIRNCREATGNVKRWDLRGDMIERWSASGLLWAENGFRRIRYAEDLPQLREALTRSQTEPISAAASTLRSESSAPIASVCEMPACPELQPTP